MRTLALRAGTAPFIFNVSVSCNSINFLNTYHNRLRTILSSIKSPYRYLMSDTDQPQAFPSYNLTGKRIAA